MKGTVAWRLSTQPPTIPPLWAFHKISGRGARAAIPYNIAELQLRPAILGHLRLTSASVLSRVWLRRFEAFAHRGFTASGT